MGTIASQIISLMILYSTVYSDANQRKYQSSASLAFVWGIHRSPVNSPHRWPVTRKLFPFDDVIMRGNTRHTGDNVVLLVSKSFSLINIFNKDPIAVVSKLIEHTLLVFVPAEVLVIVRPPVRPSERWALSQKVLFQFTSNLVRVLLGWMLRNDLIFGPGAKYFQTIKLPNTLIWKGDVCYWLYVIGGNFVITDDLLFLN